MTTLSKVRIVFWRSFYVFYNPLRRLYWRIGKPEVRGAKCVIEHEGRVLLVRLAYAHKGWTFPGGGVKRHETFHAAARREVEEETGIPSDNLTFFYEYRSQRDHKRDVVQCFCGRAMSPRMLTDPLEIQDADWFAINALPEPRTPRVDEIVAAYRSFGGAPELVEGSGRIH